MTTLVWQKQPGETILITTDFSEKMVTGETIASIDSTAQALADGSSTNDLTISGAVISGQTVEFLAAGGTIPNRIDVNEKDYKVTITVTTSASQVLENDESLKVKEL